MRTKQQVEQNRTQVPHNHRSEFILFKIFPDLELRRLVLGIPQELTLLPVGLTVLLRINRALHLPRLAHFHKMLGSHIAMPVLGHPQRVDTLEDISHDLEGFFLFGLAGVESVVEGALVGLGDHGLHGLVDHRRLDVEETVLEFEVFLVLAEHRLVEVNGLFDAQRFHLVVGDEAGI